MALASNQYYKTKPDTFANSVDPDETDRNEHNPHWLPFCLLLLLLLLLFIIIIIIIIIVNLN